MLLIKRVNTRFKTSRFLETKEEKEELKPETMGEKFFEDKIKRIQERLGG
jgi:hypothetical protein